MSAQLPERKYREDFVFLKNACMGVIFCDFVVRFILRLLVLSAGLLILREPLNTEKLLCLNTPTQ